MFRISKIISLLILTFLCNISCTTTNSGAIPATSGWILDLPFAVIKSFDRPGPYGNWWQKEPLETEKEFFTKALSGPLSPKDNLKDGDFIGWYGVLIGCEPLTKTSSRLSLDHRFASEFNVMFGLRDSESIHTISLFGDGIFTANINNSCNSLTALPGDLLRVYGSVNVKNKSVNVETNYKRYWPRSAYELAPERPARNQAGTLNRDKSGWPELSYDKSVISRRTSVDEKILESLQPRLNNTSPEIRSRVVYSLGELGEIATTTLLKAQQTEQDQTVIKSLEFAIKRSKAEIGPYWKESAPEPYWKR